MFSLDHIIVVPDEPLGRDDRSTLTLQQQRCAKSGMHLVAALAAKLSRRRRWQYAAAKLFISIKMVSVAHMDLHPTDGFWFGVEKDRLSHAIFAEAIISAYSVIEELGFQPRASQDRPFRLENGQVNPVVKQDLEEQLRNGGIDIDAPLLWAVRGPRNRIEKKKPHPQGMPLSWTRGPIRDRQANLIYAIERASFLRSKVSSHVLGKTSALAASLTVLDVWNVQRLARRLLLETTGVLPLITAE